MDPTLIGLIVLVVLNIFVWVFASGRMTGKVNSRLNNVEKRLNDPPILPQCQELFIEIKEGLSELNGEIKGMLITMKGYQKDSEGKQIKRRSRRRPKAVGERAVMVFTLLTKGFPPSIATHLHLWVTSSYCR